MCKVQSQEPKKDLGAEIFCYCVLVKPGWCIGQGLGLGLHSNSVLITPKLLHLDAGDMSPVVQPLVFPGNPGKSEGLLQHKQMSLGRLRSEQKAPSETVSPLHQTGC